MARKGESILLTDEPRWYKDAIIYELHVRAFADSNGDGIGDFRGLTERIDYLHDLGVTAIWLLPFYPSPLRDDGYDIAEYTKVNPAYGDIADFKRFLKAAHERGIRVITELVVNHTSDQHPWFKRARKAKPGSAHRDFYVWSDTAREYSETRIIFQDFETSNWTWDPVAGAYFWHRFYSHQPDLNFDNPQVHKALFRVMDFWFDMGVDGMRLDAVPYLYEREGTNCENLPETHAFLKQLRAHLDSKYDNRMLLAEANQWPEDAIAYFGDGDECHMNFHFPLMPRLFMSVRMEDRYPIIDILHQTPDIPQDAQWALFLRNHDELTLEMVTDEERDYMYRMYAGDRQARINLGIRRRLAPLLQNNRRKIELLNGLLFSLPGTPVLYYGDEIGMGDNIYLGDRDSVRTPMQWSADRNGGFSRANPQKLFLPVIIDPEYHHEAINVESQRANPHSLFWWMKRLIAIRQRHSVFGRGELEFLYPDNHKVLAFLRKSDEETILVVANLSRFAQCVELDLSDRRGDVPVELFGHTEFPRIGELPYFLTLGPHTFYWFALTESREKVAIGAAPEEDGLPTLTIAGDWRELFKGKAKSRLANALPTTMARRRWFGGKARSLQDVDITEVIPLAGDGADVMLILAEVAYTEGEPETYQIPLAFAPGEGGRRLLDEAPQAAVAHVAVRGGESGVLFDAAIDPNFGRLLMSTIERRRRFKGTAGEICGERTAALRRLGPGKGASPPAPRMSRAEQSNTSIIFGDSFILKMYRRASPGVNPDLEIGRYLTEERRFINTAPVAGSIEHQRAGEEPRTLAVLQGLISNEGDGWEHAMDALGRYFEQLQILTSDEEKSGAFKAPPESLRDLLKTAPAADDEEMIGPYLLSAEQLGQRTAEMHLALGAETDDPAFAPESFTAMYRRSLYQSMRNLTGRSMRTLRGRREALPAPADELANRLLGCEDEILEQFKVILDKSISAKRMRVHGDYHLGQVLFTGRDFVIIDFEGEPARSLTERRLKRSCLRDVAGMLRSFEYASYTAMIDQGARWSIDANSEHWRIVSEGAGHWRSWTQRSFLKSYLERVRADIESEPIIPEGDDALFAMLDVYLLEKAMYELAYELNNRPKWVEIPLRGILALTGHGSSS